MALKTLKSKLGKGLAIAAGLVGLASSSPAQAVFLDIVERNGATNLQQNTTYTFDVVARTDGQPSSGVSFMDLKVDVNNAFNYGFAVSNTVIPTANDFFAGVPSGMLTNSVSYNNGNGYLSALREVNDPSESPSPSTSHRVASFDMNTGLYSGNFNLNLDDSSVVKDFDGNNFSGLGLSFDSYSGTVAVPEPSTYALMTAVGALALASLRRRKRSEIECGRKERRID